MSHRPGGPHFSTGPSYSQGLIRKPPLSPLSQLPCLLFCWPLSASAFFASSSFPASSYSPHEASAMTSLGTFSSFQVPTCASWASRQRLHADSPLRISIVVNTTNTVRTFSHARRGQARARGSHTLALTFPMSRLPPPQVLSAVVITRQQWQLPTPVRVISLS